MCRMKESMLNSLDKQVLVEAVVSVIKSEVLFNFLYLGAAPRCPSSREESARADQDYNDRKYSI